MKFVGSQNNDKDIFLQAYTYVVQHLKYSDALHLHADTPAAEVGSMKSVKTGSKTKTSLQSAVSAHKGS